MILSYVSPIYTFHDWMLLLQNAKESPPHIESEKGLISTYKLEGKSISFIARELKDSESYGTRKCPPKISNAARRRLFREPSKGQSSSRDQQNSQNLPIIPRRVFQLLHESPNLVYWNRKTTRASTA